MICIQRQLSFAQAWKLENCRISIHYHLWLVSISNSTQYHDKKYADLTENWQVTLNQDHRSAFNKADYSVIFQLMSKPLRHLSRKQRIVFQAFKKLIADVTSEHEFRELCCQFS